MPTATPRALACALLAAVAALVAPTAANASPTQLSLFQDDAELFGERGEDPAAAMAELRELGVDVLRTNVLFYRTYRASLTATRKPSGFNTADPGDPRYNWSPTDRIVDLAEQNGIDVFLTVSGPGPAWSSSQPGRCQRSGVCTWKPKPSEFGQFVAAAAKRYRGRVDYYSLYNEPNLKVWITPEVTRTRAGKVEAAGVLYRKLWQAGYKSISRFDGGRRGRVLFGEVAAIGDPLPLLGAALCLDLKGKPLTEKLRKAHSCPKRPGRLNIGGYAIHPYNFGAFGTPQTKLGRNRPGALSQAYLPRLHRFMANAAKAGRTPGGRGIFITEFGYQTRPPDPRSNVSPAEQAQYINESDRLFFGDRRVKTVAQYELVDVRDRNQFNSGLRFVDGSRKPAYEAYRVPIVVTRRSGSSVEVYGQVRPARLLNPGVSAQVAIQVEQGGVFQTVGTAFGNPRGIFRKNISRAGAAGARWRLVWQDPRSGTLNTSRVATVRGKPLRYFNN